MQNSSFFEDFSQKLLECSIKYTLELEIPRVCYMFFYREDRSFQKIIQSGYHNPNFSYRFLQEKPQLLNSILEDGYGTLRCSSSEHGKNSDISAIVDKISQPHFLLLVEFTFDISQEAAKNSLRKEDFEMLPFLRILMSFLIQAFQVQQKKMDYELPVWLKNALAEVNAKEFLLIIGEAGSGQEEFIAKLLQKKVGFFANTNYFYPGRLSAAVQLREIFGDSAGARLGGEARVVGLVNDPKKAAVVIREIANLDLVVQQRIFEYLLKNRDEYFWIFESSRNLLKMVEIGQFSEKLYKLLNKEQVILPPLRVAKKYIANECHRFLRKLSRRYARKAILSEIAIQKIEGYDWPGNWRELKATLESAFHLSRNEIIDAEDLHLGILSVADLDNLNLRKITSRLEKNIILQAYSLHAGNQVQMAKALGISRGSLQYKLRQYHLKKE